MPEIKYGRAPLAKTATQAGDFFLGSNFGYEIEGVTQNGINKIENLKMEFEVTPYKDGEAFEMRSRPGRGRPLSIVVHREWNGDPTFGKWMNNVGIGQTDRRSMTIKFLTDDHQAKGQVDLFNAWPSEYIPPSFNARSSAHAVEKLTIQFEEWKFS